MSERGEVQSGVCPRDGHVNYLSPDIQPIRMLPLVWKVLFSPVHCPTAVKPAMPNSHYSSSSTPSLSSMNIEDSFEFHEHDDSMSCMSYDTGPSAERYGF